MNGGVVVTDVGNNLVAVTKRNVESLIIPDDWKEKFLAKIETWQADENGVTQSQIEKLRAELSTVKASLQRINIAFADGHLDLEEFKEIKNPLVPRKTELERQLISLQTTNVNRLEPLKEWVLQANSAQNMVLGNEWLEMKSFLKEVGSNRRVRK